MKKILVSVLFLLASSAAMAGDFRYTYFDGGYGEQHSGDALYFGGAFDIQQGFGIVGAYYSVDFDNDVDADIFTLGGQFHTALDKRTEFVGSVQLINADWDYVDRIGHHHGEDDTGLLLRGGIRFAVQQNLQLEGDISYITNDFWDGDELGLKAGVRFFVDRQLSLAAGFASDQELDGLYISGRYDIQ